MPRKSKKKLKSITPEAVPLSPSSIYSRREHYFVLLGLAVLIAIAFGRALGFDFMNFDVMDYLTRNRMVQAGLTWEGVKWAFTTFKTGDWHPLVWLSFMLDCQLFGVNAFGTHLINIILHGLNACLLFYVLRKYTRDFWRPVLVAAFFAVHPLRVESVVWAAERKDVLSGLFWMFCMLGYHRYAAKPSKGRMAALTGLLFLGIMTKPILVVFPFTLLLMDYWPLERFKSVKASHLVFEKIPLFLVSFFSCFMSYYAVGVANGIVSLSGLPMSDRLINAVISYARYFQKTVWPEPLAHFYPHLMRQYSMSVLAASIVLLTVLTFAVLNNVRKNPPLAVGWLWFLGALFPVIGLLQVGDQAMADRYTYIPHIGLFMAAGWGIFSKENESYFNKKILAGGFAALLFLMTGMSWRQTGFWRDAITLNQHTISVTKNNYMAHQNLAFAYTQKGDTQMAAHHYQKSLQSAPTNRDALSNLANFYLEQDKLEEAETVLLFTRGMNPNDVGALVNLGVLSALEGRVDKAIEYYNEALSRQPLFVPAHKGLAALYLKKKDKENALRRLESILELTPTDRDAHKMLGTILVSENKFEEAHRHFSTWLAQNLTDPDAHHWVGDALYHLQRYDEALPHYEQAIKLNPEKPAYYRSLGRLYGVWKRYEEALLHLNKSIELDPRYAPSYSTIGKVYFEKGDVETAIRHYQTALRLNPKLPRTHKRMADALMALNQKEEALKHYREALRLLNGKYSEVENILAQMEQRNSLSPRAGS